MVSCNCRYASKDTTRRKRTMRMCEHLTRRPKVLVFPFSAARTFKLSTSLTVEESDLPVLALAPPVFIFE